MSILMDCVACGIEINTNNPPLCESCWEEEYSQEEEEEPCICRQDENNPLCRWCF